MNWWPLAVVSVFCAAALVYMWHRTFGVQHKLRRATAKLATGEPVEVDLEDPTCGTITLTAGGFAAARDQTTSQIKWDDVIKICAYKRDMLTTDLICWSFHCRDDDDVLEVHEQMVGYKGLQEAVRSRFDVRLEDWFEQVAFPAFATNVTVIWPKNQKSETSADGQ
jgi:hypothetical protein